MLKKSITETKETFIGLTTMFRYILGGTNSNLFVLWIKQAIALILAGISTPLIFIICYLVSFAESLERKTDVLQNQTCS
jgi:hypothetical protein